jgi:hypothetical protein
MTMQPSEGDRWSRLTRGFWNWENTIVLRT